MKRFLQISRAPFFTAVIIPVLFGIVLAYRYGNTFHPFRSLVILAAAVAAHAGANLLNDYYDARSGADANNPHRNPFSGGSPHIVEGALPPQVFLRAGLTSLSVALICGAWLVWVVDHGPGPIVLMALAGLLGGVLYTAPPVKLSYRGWGEIAIFLCFGILPVFAAHYVNRQIFILSPAISAIPLALLITNIIWINEFPDCDSDRAAGKMHLVARMGVARARYVYYTMAALAYAGIILLVVFYYVGKGGLLGLLGIPFSWKAAHILHRHYPDPPALIPAQAATIMAHLVTGLGLILGILLWP